MVNRKQLNHLFWTFLCVGMLLWPERAVAHPRAGCAVDVIVQAGDSLSAIATRRLGNAAAYQCIVAATNAQATTDPT